jgi:acyl dehydratase
MSATGRTPTGPSDLASLSVGDEAASRIFGPITRTDIVRYQGASGDFHPLHHDEPFAHATGFPSVFSVGMLQAGLLATFATEWLGVDELRRFAIRFEEQVWPGDELTCTGRVTAADGERVTVELRMTRSGGGLALSGSAEFARV